MKTKQYTDMTTIMQFCRIFTEQMYNCMKNAGLLKQGYELRILVGRSEFPDIGVTMTGSVELEKSASTTPDEEWENTRMDQIKLAGKEWQVHADPIAETGSLPPEVRIFRRDSGKTETVDRKAYAPDGMWISAADNDSAVDSGV